MLNLKKILLFVVLLCAGTQANAAPSTTWWWFGMDVSPICSIPSNLSNVLDFDVKPYLNAGGYICNEDAAMNMVMDQQTADAVSPLKSGLAEVGYDRPSKDNAFFSSFWNVIILGISYLLICAGACMLVTFLFAVVKSGDAVGSLINYKNRLLAMLLSFMFVKLAGSFLMMVFSLNVFVANANLSNNLATIIEVPCSEDTQTDCTNKSKLEQSEKFVLSSNSAAQFNVAMEENVTTSALFMFNKSKMVSEPGALFGSLTKDEAIEEAVKQGRLTYQLTKSRNVNVDVTSNLSNIFNAYKIGQRYTALKLADYSAKDRPIWGYKTAYGTIEIGSNGGNIETQASESANDGTLMNQLRAVQKQAAETMGQQRLPQVEGLTNKILAEMNSSTFQSTDLVIDDAIRAKAKASVKANIESNLKLDKIGLKNPASYDIVNGYAYANFMSGARGHDMTDDGDLLRQQQDYAVKNIILLIRDAYCTDNWDAYKQERQQIANFNDLPGTVKIKDLSREDYPLSLACGNLNATTHKIDILGSDDQTKITENFKRALATKLAFDRWDASVYLGVKDALSEDKGHQAALNYSILLKYKEGILGAGLADIEVSNYQNAKLVKSRALNNNLFFTFANSGIDKYNYVNQKMLFGDKEIDTSSEEYNTVSNAFPPLSEYFNNLSIASVANITPSSLVDSASTEKLFDINRILTSLLGQDLDSLKLLAKLPLNKSAYAGAVECKAEPLTCEGNPTIGFQAGMKLLGDEYIDFAYMIIGGSVAADIIVGGKDLIGSAVETATSGIGMEKFGPVLKFAYNTSTALLMAVAYGAKIYFGTLKPFAYIMLGLGYFCKFFIPMMKVFIIIGVLIPLSWSIAVIKFATGPYLLVRAMCASDDRASAQFMSQFGNQVSKVALALPVFSLIYIIGNYMLSNFDPSNLIRSILTLGDGGFIDQLLLGFMCVAMLVSICWAQLKAIKDKYNEVMEVFTHTKNNYDDSAMSELQKVAQNAVLMNIIRESVDKTTHKITATVGGLAHNKAEYRKRFNEIPNPQDSGGGRKREEA